MILQTQSKIFRDLQKKAWHRISFVFIFVLLVPFGLINNAKASSLTPHEAKSFADFIRDSLMQAAEVDRDGKASKKSLCIIGNDEVAKTLAAENKGVIDLTNDSDKSSSCKVAYISATSNKNLKSEIRKLNSSGVLTVAVFEGFTEIGGMLQIQMGRRDFELVINSREVKASGIELNALILNLVIN